MHPLITNGLTVKQLKELIKDWPEEDEYGELTEVWLEDMSGTTQAREVWPLNSRENSADLLITFGD